MNAMVGGGGVKIFSKNFYAATTDHCIHLQKRNCAFAWLAARHARYLFVLAKTFIFACLTTKACMCHLPLFYFANAQNRRLGPVLRILY